MASIVDPPPDGKTRVRRDTVDRLTPSDFGLWVDVPGHGAGYLYGIDDQYHDGYPDRTLTLVGDDGYGFEYRFTDSDPARYPKTAQAPCVVALHPMGVRA